MNAVRLRILTEKSVIWFGKYEGQTVRQLIDNRKASYIRWCYYFFEGISFCDEVLKEVGILSDKHDDRIQKPGKNIELHNILTEKFGKAIIGKKIAYPSQLKAEHKREKKRKYKGFIEREKRYFSKKNLAWRNQGQ